MHSFHIIPALVVNLVPAAAAWALGAWGRRGPGARRALAAALPGAAILASAGLRVYIPFIVVLGWVELARLAARRRSNDPADPPAAVVAAWCTPPALFALLVPLRLIPAEPLAAAAVTGLASVAACAARRTFAPGFRPFTFRRVFPQSSYTRWGGLREPERPTESASALWSVGILYTFAAACGAALIGWALGAGLFRHVWAMMIGGTAGSLACDIGGARGGAMAGAEAASTLGACVAGFALVWLAG